MRVLHDGLTSLLVPAAMTSLYLERLPPDQLDTVDGELRTRPGSGPTRVYGRQVATYFHLGLRFAARSEDVDAAHAEMEAARDIMVQYPAGEYSEGGLDFGRIDIGSPFYLGQDARERAIIGLFGEIWVSA